MRLSTATDSSVLRFLSLVTLLSPNSIERSLAAVR